jgi:uncharacterized phage protein gp47/JayE
LDDIEIPDFLDEDQDTISKRMQEAFPQDIDTSEGSYVGDSIRPFASEESRFKQFSLVQTMRQIFPQTASEEWLDYHAENAGIGRKAAVPASGSVTVTGKAGTVVPAGTVFSTTSVNDTQSMDFVTTTDKTIADNGTVDIEVTCSVPGTDGNVQSSTIILKGNNSANGITAVTNKQALTGGTDLEDDESLRSRILYIDRTHGQSYVGSVSDYKRWALTVPGTGSATIISARDDSGLVKIVLTDSNGAPASETLCTAVYDFIMHPDDPALRLAPINANISVVPPEEIQITIAATIELENTNIETVKEQFKNGLLLYFGKVPDDGEIRYTKISAILSETSGIHDFKALTINGKTDNIPIGAMATPVIKEINFNGGDV